mgnify:CR=1 FL=1
MMKAKQTAFFAKNVDMSLQNGWGSVLDAASGILLLRSYVRKFCHNKIRRRKKAGTRSIKAASP